MEKALEIINANKNLYYQNKNATKIFLNETRIKVLPEELFDLIWLEDLVISDSEGSEKNEDESLAFEIPKNIKKLINLKRLTLSGTLGAKWSIKNIEPISSLEKLEYLDISRNRISDLTPISELVNLEALFLSGNDISDFSPLSNLTNLKELHFSSNQIEKIDCISNFSNLKVLRFASNKVKDLTPLSNLSMLERVVFAGNMVEDLSPLSDLEHLVELDFSHNFVKDVSPLLFSFRKKLSVYGKDNPLIIPPIEIFERGRESILFYFNEIEKDRDKLYEAKCLFIGEGGAGKTTLVHKLFDAKSNPPKEQDTTKGIEVLAYDFKTKDSNEFRLHLWDFGGQEIYHATHQLFLTKRSIYVLLDDTRKDDKTIHDPIFSYWLQVAELFGNESPLIIVQNEKGGRSKQIDEKAIKERFSFFRRSFQTDLLEGKGLEEVREGIEKLAWQLPNIGTELPKRWVDIRRSLKYLSNKENYISIDKYYTICEEHGLEKENADLLGGFFHDLGVFLHFKDNLLLKNIIIINNQWVTDAIYKIIDNETVKKQFGRFGRDDLKLIWNDSKYIKQHDELVTLMEKFELCYQLPDESENTWLAPQLLQISQPTNNEFNWPEKFISVRYKYNFMPRGLLSRFIVRINRYVKNLSFAWKTGVVIERSNSKAIIVENWGDREINIKATGVLARELITIITDDFDRMHNSFGKLMVEKLIPCICSFCKSNQTTHFYQYSSLIRRRESGKLTIECDLSFEDISVSELIDVTFSDIDDIQNAREINILIENGNTQEALKKLSNHFNSQQVSLWQSSFAIHDKSYKDNLISFEQYASAVQKINAGIIEMLSKFR